MAVFISLKLVYTPVDDNVTAPHKSQVTSHKPTYSPVSLGGIQIPDGWDQIPYRPGWVLHQTPCRFGFDSQTRGYKVQRGTKENKLILCEITGFLTGPNAPCVKVPGSSRVPCPPLSSPPHANSFVIGPAVIKHTYTREQLCHGNRSCSNKTHIYPVSVV